MSNGKCEIAEQKYLQQEVEDNSSTLTQQPAEAQKGVWETQLGFHTDVYV